MLVMLRKAFIFQAALASLLALPTLISIIKWDRLFSSASVPKALFKLNSFKTLLAARLARRTPLQTQTRFANATHPL